MSGEITASLDATPVCASSEVGTISVPESLSTLPSLYILRKGEKSLATSLLTLASMEVEEDEYKRILQDFLCGRERCVNNEEGRFNLRFPVHVGFFGFGHKDMVRTQLAIDLSFPTNQRMIKGHNNISSIYIILLASENVFFGYGNLHQRFPYSLGM